MVMSEPSRAKRTATERPMPELDGGTLGEIWSVELAIAWMLTLEFSGCQIFLVFMFAF